MAAANLVGQPSQIPSLRKFVLAFVLMNIRMLFNCALMILILILSQSRLLSGPDKRISVPSHAERQPISKSIQASIQNEHECSLGSLNDALHVLLQPSWKGINHNFETIPNIHLFAQGPRLYTQGFPNA